MFPCDAQIWLGSIITPSMHMTKYSGHSSVLLHNYSHGNHQVDDEKTDCV